MKIFDVAVIGSGPSGSFAAYHLAKAGISTVIIEKNTLPRYKTCGGGLVFRGRKMLPFDISDAMERDIHEIDIVLAKKDLHLKTKREEPIVTMIMRDTFDHAIVKQAQENGATLLENHEVKNIVFADVNEIETTSGTVYAKTIIASDGALSPTAKLAGWEETRMICPALEYEITVPQEDFDRFATVARFDIDAVPYGYGWVFPKKNHLSVGVGSFMKSRKKVNLKELYQDYLNELGLHTILSSEAHGFVIPISPRSDGFYRKGVLLTGDTAGFADPVTAEGISNALYSGQLAAEAIIESNNQRDKIEEIYNAKLNEKLLPELHTGVILAKLFYDNIMLKNLILKKYGNYYVEAMADVFMGKRSYPKDYKASLKRKIKEYIGF